ncbi:nucleotide exchange factor GrpE [Candidatus Kaiserbacteria bacterium]|nr:nucleotide exchange factor GrpE [Candidatus Kaiserbacteria bacterium]
MKDENEDIIMEPDMAEEEVGAERAEEKLAKLRQDLSACREEKQEYMDGWQRSKADYVNLLKRIENDTKASELRGKVRAVETLLPAFDALERAKEHLPAGRQAESFPEGFLAIAKQLESAFSALGLEELGQIGEGFDPAIHEAFGRDIVDTPERDDVVTAVLERGWKIHGMVIRPAKVRVGHFAGGESGE